MKQLERPGHRRNHKLVGENRDIPSKTLDDHLVVLSMAIRPFGSSVKVRLAKEKTSNKLYAVKMMNKDFLKKRQVQQARGRWH